MMWSIVVPGIAFYNPPLTYSSAASALRRAKAIAAVYPHATVDLYRDDKPVFAIGASQFGGCCAGATPSRLYSEFVANN